MLPVQILLKRARAKFLSVPIAAGLAELRSPLEKSYRNAVYCNCDLKQESGKITGKYCGTRWCLVCGRIRTARAIQRYLPVVKTWEDRWFVTLTIPNMPAALLAPAMARMVKESQLAKRSMARTHQVKLIALRKLECTYNKQRDDYHPHFHFVVDGLRAAQLLRETWLERYPEAVQEAQDIRPADDATLNEMFKYFTKLVTKQKKRPGTNGPARSTPVPSFALDTIFRAMHGRRVYQPVGFVVVSDAPDDEAEITPEIATDALTLDRTTWEWSQGAADWIDASTGECLTGYEPGERFRSFVDEIGRAPPDSS